MKNFKKLICLVLTLVLLFTLAGCKSTKPGKSEGDFKNGVVWNYDADAKKLTIKGSGEIPDDTKEITKNFANVVEEVVIGNGITRIGSSAFADCKKLSGLTIGDKVESIGKEAFIGCNNLKEIIVPGKVKDVDDCALGYKDKKTVNRETSIRTASKEVQSYCMKNSIVYIPQTVVKATVDTEFNYTGNNHIPNVTVRDENGSFVAPEKYEVKYAQKQAIEPGEYKLSITMKDPDFYLEKTVYTFKVLESGDVAETTNSEETTQPISNEEVTESTTETTAESTTESSSERETLPTAESNSSESSASGAYVGKVKNGTVSCENGVYYITDDATGVKFIIVNKTYTLPSSYGPGGLTSDCSAAFNKLAADAKADGISLNNRSGYRSYSYQNTLYNNYVSRDGKSAADRYSARPGHSEHQTGLAIDCNSLSQDFAYTPEGKWLAANCWKYGFILRFREGKESKTGYMYEPWHIRYIGSSELAEKLTNSGLCVEEYYGITSSYS